MDISAALATGLKEAEIAKQNSILRPSKLPIDRQQIKKVAQEFESIFLGIVLKSMRATVPKTGLLDGGNAEEIYRSLLDVEYAKMMSTQTGGHGTISQSIEDYLLKNVGDVPQREIRAEKSETLQKDVRRALKAYNRP